MIARQFCCPARYIGSLCAKSVALPKSRYAFLQATHDKCPHRRRLSAIYARRRCAENARSSTLDPSIVAKTNWAVTCELMAYERRTTASQLISHASYSIGERPLSQPIDPLETRTRSTPIITYCEHVVRSDSEVGTATSRGATHAGSGSQHDHV